MCAHMAPIVRLHSGCFSFWHETDIPECYLKVVPALNTAFHFLLTMTTPKSDNSEPDPSDELEPLGEMITDEYLKVDHTSLHGNRKVTIPLMEARQKYSRSVRPVNPGLDEARLKSLQKLFPYRGEGFDSPTISTDRLEDSTG